MTFGATTRGFTLIELLVVVLLLGIVLGMIGLQIGGDDTRAGEQETERLALLVQMAQQEAILRGDVLALRLDDAGYTFLRLNEQGEFKPFADEILRERRLPQNVTIAAVNLEGVPAEQRQTGIMLLPTGELTAFTVTIAQGTARWRVEGTVNGSVRFEREA